MLFSILCMSMLICFVHPMNIGRKEQIDESSLALSRAVRSIPEMPEFKPIKIGQVINNNIPRSKFPSNMSDEMYKRVKQQIISDIQLRQTYVPSIASLCVQELKPFFTVACFNGVCVAVEFKANVWSCESAT